MEQICSLHYTDTDIIRINDSYVNKAYATDLLESDSSKLDIMFRLGCESFNRNETELRILLTKNNR